MKRICVLALIVVVISACASVPPRAPSQVSRSLVGLLSERPLLVLGERHRDREWHVQVNRLLQDPMLFCALDDVVVEFGNARHQELVDRYVIGEDIPAESLRRVWRDTTQWLVWDSPVYAQLLSTVRDMNALGYCDHSVRVLLGDPPIDWSMVRTPVQYEPYSERDDHFANVLQKHVLAQDRRALIIVGSAHTYRHQPEDRPQTLVERVEAKFPGTVSTVTPVSATAATELGIDAGATPHLVRVRDLPSAQRSFSVLISPRTAVQVTRDGEKMWMPIRDLPWRSIAETVDALLVLQDSDDGVDPDPAIYRDPAYQAELRRRGRVLEAFYGFDFLSDLEALLGAESQAGLLHLKVDDGQAQAVLALADASMRGGHIGADDWQRLETSPAYLRWTERQRGIGYPVDKAAFRNFVQSADLRDQLEPLRAKVGEWSALDPSTAGAMAAAYLPAGARLRATVYPLIKASKNTFVYDLHGDPAIFFSIDTSETAFAFTNTLAHELHHVGVAAACAGDEEVTTRGRSETVLKWLSAFSEGRAMLAAAGGPDSHPHVTSSADAIGQWERDLKKASGDAPGLEAFFTALMDDSLAEDAATRQGMTFINDKERPQGPFYTVGWLMAATVEQEFGRDRLVASTCAPERLLLDYDDALRQREVRGIDVTGLPRWTETFLSRLQQIAGHGETRASAP
ncbi:MAG: hypothetical protein A3E01_01610 [Gammaproteobacteria bacterium RIFCSPHIGHO2_12_FULL_63_22]|nr:MAG: hypothetical protein A3E01_01610 [Gammaproteobacteria bacterium RIFCSPHIGHO2_12_FULL_63_22]